MQNQKLFQSDLGQLRITKTTFEKLQMICITSFRKIDNAYSVFSTLWVDATKLVFLHIWNNFLCFPQPSSAYFSILIDHIWNIYKNHSIYSQTLADLAVFPNNFCNFAKVHFLILECSFHIFMSKKTNTKWNFLYIVSSSLVSRY